MKPFFYILAMTALSACSTTTTITTTVPTPPVTGGAIGTAANGGGGYQVTQNSTFYGLPAPNLPQTAAGIDRMSDNLTNLTYNAAGYADSNVVAAGGIMNGAYFAGITGTTSSNVPISGSASYSGGYSLLVNGSSFSASLDLTADFVAKTLTDSSPTIVVDGSITGANITGTVSFLGVSGELLGGFYGTTGQTMVGAVYGTNIAGVILGQEVP